jgi:hypothetical protein
MADATAAPSNARPTAPTARSSSATERAWTGTLVWGSSLFVFALAAILVAYDAAMHFNGPAIDGAFQLYNGLRRIAGGFRPGVDFQYFHGLGIPYLHYPFFRMFGAGLRGSELARQLLTTVIYPIVLVVAFRAFAGDMRRALCLAAAAFALTFVLHLSTIVFPINGMLGVRSSLPTLIPAIAALIAARRARMIVVGAALGFALFLSTEQGLAVIVAFGAVSVIALLRGTDRREQIVESAGTVAVAIFTFVLCLTAVGGVSGMRGALRYNLRLVPMDQYWYFGAPPNTFVTSWHALPFMLVGLPLVGGAIVLAVIAAAVYGVRFWKTPAGAGGRRNLSLFFLALYAVVSCGSLLGVYTGAYVQPCWRVLLIIGLVEWSDFTQRVDASNGRGPWLGAPRGTAVATLGLSLVAFATIPLLPRVYVSLLPHVIMDHGVRGLAFGTDGIWPQALVDEQRAIDTHRGPDGKVPTLWSTYAGWIEARNGIFHPSFDYIIHALGPDNRQAYLDTFRATRPTLVQTVRPTVTQYEAWIESSSWAFYEELLHSYTISSISPWSIFWERRATPAPDPQLLGTMIVPPGMTAVRLPPIPDSLASSPTLLDVDVEYETKNPWRWLPVVGGSPRYLVELEGSVRTTPISLDPYVRREQFPVIVDPRQPVTLHFETYSLLPGASLTPRRITVSVRRIDGRNRFWLESLTR